MFYIIQLGLYNIDGFSKLIRALDINNCPYSIHRVIPFSDVLIPVPQVEDKNVIPFGANTMLEIANLEGLYVYKNENFNLEIQNYWWNDFMLNADGKICAIKYLKASIPVFIRPVLDSKSFAGKVFLPKELADWKESLAKLDKSAYSTVSLDTMIIAATEKILYKEYRFFIVAGQISTYTTYKPQYDQIVEHDCIEFVEKVISTWKPHDNFVLDIALTPQGYKIIEVNCLNSAAFYNSDVNKLIADLKNYHEDF